jgi:putative metallohydrolase (TIGR04338 family)
MAARRLFPGEVNPRERQLSLYAGEEAALGAAGRRFRDLREVRAYLDQLIASDWWADRWPHIEAIPVARTRSGRFSGYAVEESGEIRLRTERQVNLPSVGSVREAVVLHEVAHVVTPGAGHGPAFVEALLALVRERLGFHAYGALLAELRRRDVVGEGDSNDSHQPEDPDPGRPPG